MKSTLRSLIEQISAFMPWVPDWVFAIAAFIGIVMAGLALQSLINLPNVKDMHTSFSLGEVKARSALPLGHLSAVTRVITK